MGLKQFILAFSIISLCPNKSEPQQVRIHNGAYMSYQRGRANGEMDLVSIASEDCTEDLWLFTSGTWYDVGINETTEDLEQDTAKIESILSTTSGPVIEYHIHPHNCTFQDLDGITLRPVSPQDVLAHALLSERVRPHGRMLFSKVADEHGIWSYTATQAMHNNLINLNVKELEGMAQSMYEGSLPLLNMPLAHFYYFLNRYIEQQRRHGIIISYRRFR